MINLFQRLNQINDQPLEKVEPNKSDSNDQPLEKVEPNKSDSNDQPLEKVEPNKSDSNGSVKPTAILFPFSKRDF
jgi:hypothetical protein